jgi:hypothetical protein
VTDPTSRGLFGRRRRANADAADRREKSYRVYVTAEEDVQLRARAEVQGVTVPRLLFEAAMNAQVRTDTEWKSAVMALFKTNNLLGNLTNNVNQLARFANTEGQFPADAAGIYAEFRRLAPMIEESARRVAGQ